MTDIVELELRGEFAYIDVKEYCKENIKNYNQFVNRSVECIGYSSPNMYKHKIDFILEQFILHVDEFENADLIKNNKVFIDFIKRVIESIKDRTKFINKKEIIDFENSLSNDDCSKYIKAINRIMEYLSILYA